MRTVVYYLSLIAGTSLLWTWVSEDRGDRWMLAVAVTLLVMFAVCAAPGRGSS